MLRCARCSARLSRSHLCSDLAVLTVHWMEAHTERWVEMHPGSREYLADAGLLI